MNSFSWRFWYKDHSRAVWRFAKWAAAIGEDKARLITRISFESRHEVEEGVGFSVDIDILRHSPFFNMTADTNGDCEVDKAILRELKRDFVYHLWEASEQNTADIVMSRKNLVALGSAFVRAMRRSPSDTDDDKAEEPYLVDELVDVSYGKAGGDGNIRRCQTWLPGG